MYICLECGKPFDEPSTYAERHGFHRPPYEHWTVSPCCGGAFADGDSCGLCGRPVIHDRTQRLCRRCRQLTGDQLRYFLLNDFSADQRKYLDDLLDGVSLEEFADGK